MKVLIATPAYGGELTTAYCESLIALRAHFRDRHPHIRFEQKFMSLSLLAFMRAVYASIVLDDESFTHLLFIDADMGFAPSLVEKMIAADKPVVGVMSPFRQLDLNALYALHDEIADPAIARLVAIEYVNASGLDVVESTTKDGDVSTGTSLVIDGPCIRVRDIGTGVMLIKRDVFERMKDRYPDLWCEAAAGFYDKFGLAGGLLQCFQPLPNEHGVYAGEDTAFCRRWVEGCGGEIWAVATETIAHVGPQKFVGNYLARLQHGRI